jgi:hypothetical protein
MRAAPPCWPVSGLAVFDFAAFPGALLRARSQWLVEGETGCRTVK